MLDAQSQPILIALMIALAAAGAAVLEARETAAAIAFNPGLGERRIDAAVGAEALAQACSRPEHSARPADVLALTELLEEMDRFYGAAGGESTLSLSENLPSTVDGRSIWLAAPAPTASTTATTLSPSSISCTAASSASKA